MVTVFLPCRAGSERIPNKNTKDFANVKGGLLTIKLKQLLNTKSINTIILSTNDKEVIRIAQNLSDKIIIDLRPDYLASSSTSTDDLITYVPTIIKDKHILWTHVTSPFLTNYDYENAIKIYFEGIKKGQHDSLMTVTKIQTFLWDKTKAINYNRASEKWPRTQTLPEYFEINSGIFLNSRDNYLKFNDRIGLNPYLMANHGHSSFDIDWPEDFKLAEFIYKSKIDKQ